MGNLSNLYISRSFQSLIHLGSDSTATSSLTLLQDGYGNSIGVGVNTAGDLFLSGSLTASLQQGYVWVGDNTGKTKAFATSSLVTNIDTGSLVTTASFNAYTQSNNQRVSSLESNSASVNISVSALNTFTASQSTASIVTSITNLNSTTASLNTSVTNLNASSASQQVSINSLNAATASYVTETESGSFLITASVNVNILTFTKGNGTTFDLTVASSGSSPAGTISGSAQITALGFVSSSVTASSLVTASFNNGTRNLTFTKGDASTFSVNIPDVSGSAGNFVTTSSFNAYTQSNDQRVSSLETNSASVNTSITNLNSATSSLFTSASLALVTASVSGQLLSFTKGNNSVFSVTLPTGSGTYVTGSYGAFQDSTTQSGSANTAYKMKFNTTDVSDGVILSGSTGLQVGAYGTYNLEWSGQAVQGSGAAIVSVWVNVNGIQVSGSRGDVTLSSNTKLLPAWNYFLTLNALDVVELYWASDSGNTTWQALPIGTTPITPAAASIIATLARVDVGGGSNSVSTSSFNAYTSSTNVRLNNIETTTASLLIETSNLETFSASALISINSLNGKTGSFATTGSNSFTGIQTFVDNTNFSSLVCTSGSLMLVAKSYTSSSAHLSSSFTNSVNLIFKNNDAAVDTIISGSSNIFSNPTAGTTGFKRYVGGNNNYYAGTLLPQISASMQFSPSMNRNIGNFVMSLRGPVSSSTYTLNDNFAGNIALNLGTGSGVSSFEKAISGFTFSSNGLFGGTINVLAGKTQLDTAPVMNNNLIFGATVNINHNSSSLVYNSNIQNGGITINNNYISASGAGANYKAAYANVNTVYGINHGVTFAGSNTSTTLARAWFANLMAGANISASLEGTGDNTSMVAVNMLGNALIVSASSTSATAVPVVTTDGTYGSLFAGRFNATDGNRAKTAETVFAVGTGTSYANRKTGFLIDSGSNTFIEGTLNVSGATSLNGNLIVTGSVTASLQQGYVWVGNASGITTTVATSSFGGGGAAFPYTGSAQITGSLGITGSLSGLVNTLTISSNTASMDFNNGNFFTLQLVSGSITHLTAANVKPGQTINLLVKTDSGSAAATGSLTFSSTFKFAGGFDYTPTTITASQDLVSFVTFDTTQILAAQVKNLS